MRAVLAVAVMLVMVALILPLHATTVSDDVSGVWNFVLQTPGGERTAKASFVLDGAKVTGKWNEKDDLQGSFAEGKLDLSFPVTAEETGERNDLILKGTLDGGDLAGTWAFGSYDGAFRATRAK